MTATAVMHPLLNAGGPLGQFKSRYTQPMLWERYQAQLSSPTQTANGHVFFDDFTNFGALTASGSIGGYYGYIELDATPGAIRNAAAYNHAIQLLTSTDAADGDNHDTILTTGGNTGALCSLAAGSNKIVVFETSFLAPSVTNGDGSWFVGMTEAGCAAANSVLNDDAGHLLADKNLIGFLVTEDDNNLLKFAYKADGQTAQTVFSMAIEADTWYTAGLIYDPSHHNPAQRIQAYVNNVHKGDVTAAQVAAATFPLNVGLALTAAIKGSANNDPQSLYLGHWACGFGE